MLDAVAVKVVVLMITEVVDDRGGGYRVYTVVGVGTVGVVSGAESTVTAVLDNMEIVGA